MEERHTQLCKDARLSGCEREAMLHLINGDCAETVLRAAGVPGRFLSWRDVLHDGPVPGGLPPEQLNETRARFLAACGWDSEENAREQLRLRDETLSEAVASEDEVVIWNSFELYDQLQLLQILPMLPAPPSGVSREVGSLKALSVVFLADYLGSSTSESALLQAFQQRKALTREQHALGQEGWRCVTAPSPQRFSRFLRQDLTALPFLRDGLLRFAQEYPDAQTGLSRTQHLIVQAVAAGTHRVVDLFRVTQAQEPVRFMGDTSFWRQIALLGTAEFPLLNLTGPEPFYTVPREPFPDETFRQFQASLTELGWAVLRDQVDWLAVQAHDYWIGGVHLHPEHDWRWSAGQGVFCQATAAS